jgi:S-adenosylmethionine hydrolase
MPSSPQVPAGGRSTSGIVSLTTDFGVSEPFVGLVKAQILVRHPAARIVDLTHGVPPFSTEAAAFWIERSHRYFPPGSVHVVVVDPGVGTDRRLLAVALDGQLFLAPDNGVLGPLAGMPGAKVRAVAASTLLELGIREPSATFHGRDVLGPLAGELSSGEVPFEKLGSLCDDWVRPGWALPEVLGKTVFGKVIIVDHYGNCFSNIDSKSIVSREVKRVSFEGHVLPWVRTYGDRPPGTGIALINAFGVLEAAWVEGSACRQLGLAIGSPVEVELGRPPPGGG